MNAQQLTERTKRFSLKVIALFQRLPKTYEAKVLGGQLLRSATSVGANYRAACRARSDREFRAKLSIVVEEADECLYWMELLEDSKILLDEDLKDLKDEALQLLKIFAASRKTSGGK